MSSILKALKKLEQEKSGQSSPVLNIDSNLLRESGSSRRSSPFTKALLLLLVFGGGIVVSYFVMRETKTVPPLSRVQSVPQQTNQRPLVPTQTITPEIIPDEIIIVSSRSERPAKNIREKKKHPLVAGSKTENRTSKPVEKAASETFDKANNNVNEVHVTTPSLRVNGIAFQNTSADSVAIVNGVPVSSGSSVEGATVEEIRKDRVLFQRNGDRFEIQLGQSNR
jgi:hypothetical protein